MNGGGKSKWSGIMDGDGMTPFQTLRLRIGWDREGAAFALRVSRDTVRSWDTGRREPPPEVLGWMEVLADMVEAGPPGRKIEGEGA